MKIPRLDYDPTSALAFYEESFSALGALSERTWHDRLEVVAEGLAARVWNPEGALHEQELVFAPADAVGARDALGEVFPGCPLTFRLVEALRPRPMTLEKAVLDSGRQDRAPESLVLEKLWRGQYPATRRFRLAAELKPAFHFSLVAVVRCEIQAIDQHWSLHRVAIALPGGEADDLLATDLPLLDLAPGDLEVIWPETQLSRWWPLLCQAIEREIQPEVEPVRARQQQYLRRELERLDDYFAHYENELSQRTARAGAASSAKAAERLEAARAEHGRRRLDQVARHEICVQPHVDAVLLTAEHAWEVPLEIEQQREPLSLTATFVPRARRWFRSSNTTDP
jgi:hypothetical protein